MTEINNEKIGKWWNYFEKNMAKWEMSTSDILIELGETSAIEQKILQLLDFDETNLNHRMVWKLDSTLPKSKSLDLIIFYGIWMDYDEKILPKFSRVTSLYLNSDFVDSSYNIVLSNPRFPYK